MPDREKVLYALNCRAIDSPATCAECSYYNAEWCCCNTKYIMKDALALLKEQEAKWIPVTERLPESGKHVLAACEIRLTYGGKKT